MQKSIYILFILLLSFIEITAQSTKERVQSLFSTEGEVESVRFFRGRMNDVNDVMIALGTNGKEYRGIMKFLRSNAEFRVSGQVKGKELILLETDTFGNSTGRITGTIDDFEGIKAKWTNINRTLGGSMILIPYPTEPEYPTYCGDNKWIRLYSGKIGGEKVDFLLSRGTNFNINGLAYFHKQDKSYAVEGSLANYNRDISLELRDNNYNSFGKITGKVDFKTDNIAATFQDLNDRTFESTIKKETTISVGCIEYADFITEMEVTYPKTRNIKFNEILNEYIQEWLKTSRAYTNQYKEQMKRPNSTIRASLRSYFWCNVEYFSDTIISGKATHVNTWESDYNGYAFNFDFKKNEKITLESIFKPKSGYQKFIIGYIQKEMKKRSFYSDATFQKWIKTEKFEYFTIRKDGLNFISNFNSIFGEQNCTIPYSELKDYLKAESSISFLLNTMNE